jgi:uncharacterized paraquat-inducible protein A
MARRAATLLAALSVALLVYVILVSVTFAKLRSSGMIHTGCSCTTSRAYMIAGRPVRPSVPLWCWFSLGSLLPATWTAWQVHLRARRRNRERLGLCVDCGTELPREKQGRCPRCRRAYENRAPGRGAFPVLVRPTHVTITSPVRSQNFWPVMFPAPSR